MIPVSVSPRIAGAFWNRAGLSPLPLMTKAVRRCQDFAHVVSKYFSLLNPLGVLIAP
jgi:hypothetical protein